MLVISKVMINNGTTTMKTPTKLILTILITALSLILEFNERKGN